MSHTQYFSRVLGISISLFFLLATVTFVHANSHPDTIGDPADEADRTHTESTAQKIELMQDRVGERTDAIKDRVGERTDAMRDRVGERTDSMKERVEDRTDAMRMKMDQKRDALHARIETLKHNVSDRVDTQKARVEAKATQLSDRLEEHRAKMAERKAKLSERHQARILEHVKRLVHRLNAAIERMEILAGRVQSRIDKLTERGLDMADEQALLDTALSHIASAQTDVDALEEAVIAMLESDEPREAYAKVKELVRTTIDSVKSAHKTLVEAIRSVKANPDTHTDDKDDDTATTTAQ
jgi:hypothetical protein